MSLKWYDTIEKPGFVWVNGLTGKPAFFCSRFCAAKFEITWIEPVTERAACATCKH